MNMKIRDGSGPDVRPRGPVTQTPPRHGAPSIPRQLMLHRALTNYVFNLIRFLCKIRIANSLKTLSRITA